MDDRKKIIKDLEEKRQTDTEARDRLLEGLGETLIERIGGAEPFPGTSGEEPGGILAEYRLLQKEIADSGDIIRGLEADITRLKELEEAISIREGEQSRLERDLEEVYVRLGKTLLQDSEVPAVLSASKQQEEILLDKIDEQERKLSELEEQEGGVFSWLGKNAQIAVSKTLLMKNRSTLRRLYRSAGKASLSPDYREPLAGEAAGASSEAGELGERLSVLAVDLSMLKGERRNIGDLFGSEGSPARRIQGLEKHISHVKGEFPALYRRFGALTEESAGREALASIIREEDTAAMEKAEALRARIAEDDLEIEKVKTLIAIDNAGAEIEKFKKDIQGQRQKIASAEKVIGDLEKQIADTEENIERLKQFLRAHE